MRTFGGGKEKWNSLQTTLLSVARNRMKEHLDAAEHQRTMGVGTGDGGALGFAGLRSKSTGGACILPISARTPRRNVRPDLNCCCGVGAKSKPSMSDASRLPWSRIGCASSRQPRFRTYPRGRKPPRATRPVLDVAVEAGHLYANPARNAVIAGFARGRIKAVKRERAERGIARLPTREEFCRLVDAVENAGVADCRAAADHRLLWRAQKTRRHTCFGPT